MNRTLENLRPRTWLARGRSARADLRDTRRDSGHAAAASTQMQQELAAQNDAIEALRGELAGITAQLSGVAGALTEQRQRLLLAMRMVRDDDAGARRELLDLRRRPEYQDAFDDPEPLVTVIVPTYKNWPMLRDRSLPSVLAQSYRNWECIVVGDCAPEETAEVVESFGDDRLSFVNLPYRGPYPDDSKESWMISGTPPWNAGLALARGKWIAANADDDELRPQSIDTLLQHAKRQQAEVAYGYIDQIHPDRTVTRLGTFPPQFAQWGMQASLFHSGLRFLPLLPSDWVFEITNDTSLMERMLRIGVRFAMVEETVASYYPSTLWSDDPERRLWEEG